MNDGRENILQPLGPTALSPFAEDIDEGLEKLFGFKAFRPGQREVVERLVAGKNGLVIMPTGAGKSLCYQLAGALKEGVTLVISPLIALMDDQVAGLERIGLPATAIHSGVSKAEQEARIEGMWAGDYKLVYIAPERFRSRAFLKALEGIEVGLFVVDEAHCISQWGHDFRPAYRRLAGVRERLGGPQIVALTATATKQVRKDLCEQLGLDEKDEIVTGLERPNLRFDVFFAGSNEEKLERLKQALDKYPGQSGIVYCATREQVQEVCRALKKAGYTAGSYHGGMGQKERRLVQERWMSGEVPVLVATNAFGMGVDKPDVRVLVHYNIPGSIEAYYQEAGRAGRDGEPADCLLLFRKADLRVHHWFAENSFPLRMQVIRIWLYLRELGLGRHKISAAALAKAARGPGQKLPTAMAEASLVHLARAGHIRFGGGEVEVLEDVGPLELDIDFDYFGERRILGKRQLGQILEYTRAVRCYQAVLLDYFGVSSLSQRRCGVCGQCATGS